MIALWDTLLLHICTHFGKAHFHTDRKSLYTVLCVIYYVYNLLSMYIACYFLSKWIISIDLHAFQATLFMNTHTHTHFLSQTGCKWVELCVVCLKPTRSELVFLKSYLVSALQDDPVRSCQRNREKQTGFTQTFTQFHLSLPRLCERDSQQMPKPPSVCVWWMKRLKGAGTGLPAVPSEDRRDRDREMFREL